MDLCLNNHQTGCVVVLLAHFPVDNFPPRRLRDILFHRLLVCCLLCDLHLSMCPGVWVLGTCCFVTVHRPEQILSWVRHNRLNYRRRTGCNADTDCVEVENAEEEEVRVHCRVPYGWLVSVGVNLLSPQILGLGE
jgi:hypothetical protein